MNRRTATLVILLALFISFRASTQNFVKNVPRGFDSLRVNVPHGKIDTISYTSKTVGVVRKALLYTPPGFSKKKKSCAVPASRNRRG